MKSFASRLPFDLSIPQIDSSKCDGRLTTAGYTAKEGRLLAVPQERYIDLESFRRVLHSVAKLPPQPWSIDRITSKQLDEIVADLRANIVAIMQKQMPSRASQQIIARIDELGGIQNSLFWDEYFRSYDKIVGFSQGFWDIALAASDILPTFGTVLDIGSGTGNISTVLSLLHPSRRIQALDFSDSGMSDTRQKLMFLGPTASAHTATVKFDITKDTLKESSADGAVMNNVLYALSTPEIKAEQDGAKRLQMLRDLRLETLVKIFKWLRPGAPFVLSDPRDVLQADFDTRVEFMKTTAAKALAAGSPITEYDVRFLAIANVRLLMSANPYLTSEELMELVQKAGFRIEGFYTSYYGGATFLHLVKPEVD